MTISIVNEHGRKSVRNAIFIEALFSKRTLHIKQPYTSFQVEGWTDFCRLCIRAFSKCSMDARGQEFVERVPVLITTKSGVQYRTSVWCDVEERCLRYEALS